MTLRANAERRCAERTPKALLERVYRSLPNGWSWHSLGSGCPHPLALEGILLVLEALKCLLESSLLLRTNRFAGLASVLLSSTASSSIVLYFSSRSCWHCCGSGNIGPRETEGVHMLGRTTNPDRDPAVQQATVDDRNPALPILKNMP